MKTRTFRSLIEQEITEVIAKQKEEKEFERCKTPETKSSFAFLYWFLRRYYPKISIEEMKQSIVEGTDDGSCDIIFSNKDRLGKLTYYVVQAKWFNEKNVVKTNSTGSLIKSCISDFSLIIEGRMTKSKTNEKFNEKYDELLRHIENNGKTKFLFLALCERTKEADDNIKKFNKDYGPLIGLDLFDVNRLKTDYIEIEYKEAKTHNPIETPYEPIDDIDLEIDVSNSIRITNPDESYIFLIKPQLIFRLFRKYQYSIFYRNIRNPLFTSQFNDAISTTLTENPTRFWYYNNGITAITNKIYPFNSKSGKKVTVKGIQIINGAQTVYSIYRSYLEQSDEKREFIDDRVLITLRLITSSDTKEDMKITRYTNSQNPVTSRDFRANDPIQKELQTDFFHNSNIWYETRRGEFRKRLPKKLDVKVVSNELLGQTYLSYFLKSPILAKSSRKNLFISQVESSKGIYELIFNNKTDYQDMLISYKLNLLIEENRKKIHKQIKKIEEEKEADEFSASELEMMKYKFLQYTTFNFLAAFKFLIEEINEDNLEGVNGKLIKDLEEKNGKQAMKYYYFIRESIKVLVEKKEQSQKFSLLAYFKSKVESTKDVEEHLLKTLNNKDRKELLLR
jgi:hypothetical protein